ncbi:MAG: DUF2029 domain-containing protein [Lachnospiraceae bacterium]|nr:DUF2029 domain-containing protein [Lachnospiraceae bacterium]
MKNISTDSIKKMLTPFNIFAAMVLLGFAGYLFYAYRYGSTVTDFFVMENTDLKFCDFRMHVEFVGDPKNLYSRAIFGAGCFPPLSYLMYYFASRILTRGGAVPGITLDFNTAPYAFLVIVYYTLAVSFLLFLGISLWGDDKKRAAVLFICLMISVPFFAGGVSVANSTLMVMALMLIALKLKDSESRFLRELALIIIAVCAGFKIYPAVFGLYYLLEKRFKEAIRLTIYGIVLFFSPFALFGGLEGFGKWLFNVRSTMSFNDYGRIQCIRELIVTVTTYLHIDHLVPHIIVSITPYLFVVLMIALASLTKNRYRRLFFLCAIMSFFPTNAYRYTLCYLSLPFIVYFMDKAGIEDAGEVRKNPGVAEYIETVLFSLVYALPCIFGKIMQFEPTYEIYTLTYVEIRVYVAAYLLLAFITIHEICVLIRSRNNRQPSLNVS